MLRSAAGLLICCAFAIQCALALNPTALCAFGTADINVSIVISTTQGSTSPPYGYGSSWTISAFGNKLSNNTWQLREWAVFGGNGCSNLGGEFYPDIDLELSPIMNGTYSTTAVSLLGPKSILGRSISVSDPVDPKVILGCCSIVLLNSTLTNAELSPQGQVAAQSTKSVTCSIQPTDQTITPLVTPLSISGSVTISTFATTTAGFDEIDLASPSYHWGSQISFSVFHNGTQPLDYHIHEYPVPKPGSCGDPAVGGHYNPNDGLKITGTDTLLYGLAELSHKFGQIPLPGPNNSAAAQSYVDHGVRLDGGFATYGRSIVFHSNEPNSTGERVGCCIIPFLTDPVPAIGPTEDIEAICEFDPLGDVSGQVYFRQPSGAGQHGTEIRAQLKFNAFSQQSGYHDWRIHEIATKGFVASSNDCETNGNPYEPAWENLGPSSVQAPNGVRFASGNLGAKFGFLNGGQNGAEIVFEDGTLELSGPKSVLGRSLKIYVISTASNPSQGLGCCNIVRVPPGTYRTTPVLGQRIATCDFPSNQSVTGSISLSQNTEAEGTVLNFGLSGAVSSVTSWQLSQYGITVDTGCAGSGDMYNGSTGFADYGNLQTRLGPLPSSGTIRDSHLKLSGADSILGRSITLQGSLGSTIGCCTVALTSGQDNDVRFAYAGAEATCSFSDDLKNGGSSIDAIEGFIRFRQLTHPQPEYMVLGTEIEVSLIGDLLGTTAGPKSLSVRNASIITSCSDVGPIFEPDDGIMGLPQYTAGKIGAKHGNFSGDRVSLTRYIDNSLSLFGPNSIVGRAVQIDDSQANAVFCCNIGSLITHPSYVPTPLPRSPSRAACDFNLADIKGTIIIDDVGDAVHISSNSGGFLFSGAQIGDHNYHIHLYGTTTIGNVGTHYRPFDGIGPDSNGVAFSTTSIVELGDLSGKHGKLRADEFFSYTDNQVQLGGPLSVLGRSIVIHDLSGSPYASCIIKAVDPINYFPPSYRPITIKPCSAGSTIPNFSCNAGSYTSSGNVVINPNSVITWTGYVYVVNGGISVRPSATLNVHDAELQVTNYITLNDGAVLNLAITGSSSAKMLNFLTYGGVFNIVDSRVSVTDKWDESVICAALIAPTAAASPVPVVPITSPVAATPTATQVSLPVPITVVSYLTNVTIGGVFSPCGHLQIDLKGGAYQTPFQPFTYGSINGRFSQFSYFNTGALSCAKFTITPRYNTTFMSIDVSKDDSSCAATDPNLYIIIGIVCGAVVLAIVIAIVVIAATPAGIPCRIWYRRTCGAKFSPSGRNTGGF